MQSYSYLDSIRRLQSPARYERVGDDDTSRDLAEFYAGHWNDLASQGLEPTEEGLWKAETELAGSDTVLFCDDDDGTWQVADVDAFEEPAVSRFERPSLFGGVVRYDWVTYTGKPRGKDKKVAKGWKNSETGEIRYQEKKPADRSGRKNVLKKGGASTPKTKKTAKEHDEDRAAAFSEEGLQAKLAPHADRELTPGDRTKAKRSFAALLKKHGPEKVLHRIDELASETTDPDRLRQLHEMVGWAKGEPATGKETSAPAPAKPDLHGIVDRMFAKNFAEDLASDRFKNLSKAKQDEVVARSKADVTKRMEKLAKRIDDKDIDLVGSGAFDKGNAFFRELFTQMTGIALPKTNKGADEAVRKYIGEDRIKAAADAAKAKAEEIPGGFKKGQKVLLNGEEVEVTGGHAILMQGIMPTRDNGGPWAPVDAAERSEYVTVKKANGHTESVDPKKLTPKDTKFKPVNAEMTVESATKSGFITKLKGGGWTADGTGGHVFETAAKALTAYLDQQKTAQAGRDAAEVEKWKAAPVKAIKDGQGDNATVTVHLPDGSTSVLSMRQWRQQVFDIEQKHGDVGYINRDQVPAGFSVKAEPAKAKEPWEMTREEHEDNLAKLREEAIAKWNESGGKGFPPGNPGSLDIAQRNKLAESMGLRPKTDEFIDAVVNWPQHKLQVASALAAGKPVPPEVLADYPDLAAEEQGKGADDTPDFSPDLPAGSIYKTKTKDGDRFAVRGNGKNGFGDTLHRTKEEAIGQVELNKRNAIESEKRAKERAEAEAKERAEQENERDIDGFASDLSPMKKGKIVATLNTQVRSGGEVKSRKQHIRDAVNKGVLSIGKDSSGNEVMMRSDGRLEKSDGDYQENVPYQWSLGSPATELAYAKHLLGKDKAELGVRVDTEKVAARLSLLSQAAGVSGKSIDELRRYSDEQLREMIANAGKADEPEDVSPRKETPAERAVKAASAMHEIKGYMPKSQLSVVRDAMRGEEKDFFQDKMMELADRIAKMPKTYEQDGKGEEAVAYLHYFTSGGDWYITEKDMDGGVQQAFGLADPFQDGGELGYISIEELVGAGAELDFHFTPKTLKAIKAAKYPAEPATIQEDEPTTPTVTHGDELEAAGENDSLRGGVRSGEQLGGDVAPPSESLLPGIGGGVGAGSGLLPGREDERGEGILPGPEGSGNGSADGKGTGDRAATSGSGKRGSTGGVGSRGGSGRAGDRPEKVADPSVEEESLSEQATPENPTDVVGDNFRYTTTDFAKGGLKAKFKANIEAIKTLKSIQLEGRTSATPEEQAILSRFVGWGQFPALFGYKHDPEWAKEKLILADVLSAEEREVASNAGVEDEQLEGETDEYKSSRSSTKNAHYTHPDIVKAHWKMAERLGFKGGRFLETSAGVGYYLGLMPPKLAGKTKTTAVELDKLTGQILGFLYPKTDVNVMGFQDYPAPKNFFDLVASNVPFGNYTVHDPDYNKHIPKVHDYFFLKSADITRPGGLIMHITSTGTMDKPRNASIRDELAKTCDLVAAIRFPGQAHKENAGTDVVTDMVILRKRAPGEAPDPGQDWMETVMVPDPAGGQPIPVNKYFADHPEQILGTLDRTGTMRTGKEKNVTKTADYEERLAAAIERLPQGIYKPAVVSQAAFTPDVMPAPGDVRVGGYTIKGGKLYQREAGALVERQCNAKDLARIKGIMGVRDALRAVINDELTGQDASESRVALNEAYDAFVKKYGFLNSRENDKLYSDDPDSFGVMALEDYDRKTKQATKAAIFHKYTVRSNIPVESAGTVNEALGVSLHETGGVDVDRMAQLTGKKVSEIEKELAQSGIAFLDPSLGWKPADQYLSGNVRQKLVLARAAAAADPQFKVNVEALEKVQPDDLSVDEIKVKLGAPWVPPSDIAAFGAFLLNGRPDGFRIDYLPNTGTWMFDFKGNAGEWMKRSQPAKNLATEEVDFKKIFEAALNNTSIVVYYPRERDADGNAEKAVVNTDATRDAMAKVKEIREKFSEEWIWSDEERRNRLHRHYNDNFNNIRPIKYDGQHQTFPGMNSAIELRPHQKDFVWQVVSTGNGLAAHEVGTGKTKAMIAAAMELRRLGLAKKPCIACMKANVEAIAHEAQELYPGARILTTADVFDAKSRKKTIARIATGDYDMIIMTHDNLNMLQMKPETIKNYIGDEIKELEAAKLAAYKDNPTKDNRIVKALETAKENLEAKLKKALDATKKDNAVFFEETGIDHLFVDEAHKFKALPCYTKMANLKGVPTTRSDRATSMQMRARWLMAKNNGRGLVFATGTPITNTMAEMYNMQRYLQPQDLHERGLDSFDAWANVFGETETNMEFTPSGKYKAITRFSKFTSLAELQAMSRQIMDVQRVEDLKKPDGTPAVVRPARKDFAILAPKTKAVERMMAELAERAQNLDPRDKKKDNMLAIATDGRKGSIDMRLLDANAKDEPTSKVNQCVAKVLEIANARPNVTQMIFSDMGVNPTKSKKSASKGDIEDWKNQDVEEEAAEADEDNDLAVSSDLAALADVATGAGGFHLYKDIIDKLVKGGIPREQIADFTKLEGKKKEEAQEAMRAGKIRVAIGSTEKMGTGVNVQNRLAAMHTLDVPYLPAAVEQRDGRGWRNGNMNDPTKKAEDQEVEIYRYLTEGSLDQWNWDIIERKTAFIRQIISNKKVGARELSEDDSESITPARLAAIASGDPRNMERVTVEEDVKDLRAAKKRYDKDQDRLKSAVRQMETSEWNGVPAWEKMSKNYHEAVKVLNENPLPEGEFEIELGGKMFTDRKEATDEFNRLAEQAGAENGYMDTKLGMYRGLKLIRRGNSQATGATPYCLVTPLGFQIDIGMTGSASIAHVARNLPQKSVETDAQLAKVRENLEATRAQLGKPFAKAELLKEKEGRLKQLERELSYDKGTDDVEPGNVFLTPSGSNVILHIKDGKAFFRAYSKDDTGFTHLGDVVASFNADPVVVGKHIRDNGWKNRNGTEVYIDPHKTEFHSEGEEEKVTSGSVGTAPVSSGVSVDDEGEEELPSVPQGMEALPALPKGEEDVIRFGEELPENRVEFVANLPSGKKAMKGFAVGPMAVVATGTNRSPEWSVYHQASGLKAFSVKSRHLAKAAAFIMQSKGDWSFTDQSGFKGETPKYAAKVVIAARNNDLKGLARIANKVEDESGALDLSQPSDESATASPAPADVAPAPEPLPAAVSPATEPAAPAPAPVAHPPVTVKKQDTSKGVRYVHGFKPNESFWKIWKQNKPSYLTVYKNKHSGVWEASVWGANEQEVQDNMADLRNRGLKYERPNYPLRYQMDADQPEQGEDHYHVLATMYAEMWNGLEQAGMEPTDRGIWKASEELADGEWILYHDPADEVWKVVQAEQAPKVFRYGKLRYATPPRMFVYRCPYCGGLAYQGEPVQGGVFQAYALCSRCGRGFSILGRDSVEQPRLSYARMVQCMARAAAKKYAFNENEPRDESGKWTAGGTLKKIGKAISGVIGSKKNEEMPKDFLADRGMNDEERKRVWEGDYKAPKDWVDQGLSQEDWLVQIDRPSEKMKKKLSQEAAEREMWQEKSKERSGEISPSLEAKRDAFVESHGLTFSLDEQDGNSAGRLRLDVEDKNGKRVGSASVWPDPISADNVRKLADRIGFKVDESALSGGAPYRNSIGIDDSMRGSGVGAELYLRMLGSVKGRPYFYNSQAEPPAMASMERLAKLGLIEFHRNPLPGSEQHVKRITEKGEKYLAEIDRRRSNAKQSYARTLRYAAHRVPKGYIVNKGGKIYRAGKWVSEADLRTATPVNGAQSAAASGASPKGKRVVDRQALSEKLAQHAGHVLTPEEIETAKTRFNALSGHHKELVHHRIEELANSTHAALQEAKDAAARKLLSKQMRVYQEMLAWGDAKTKAIEDAKPYAEKVKEKAAKAAPYTAAVKGKRANAKKGAYEGAVAEKLAVAKAKPKPEPEPKKETSYADKVASKAKPTASYADTVASRRRKKDPETDAGDREAFNAVNDREEPGAEPERDKPISARDIPEPWGGTNEPIQEPYAEQVKKKTVRKSKDDGEDYFALPSKRRPSKFDAATEDLGGKTYAEVIAEKMKKASVTS